MLCFHLSLHLPAIQTGVAALSPGLEAASTCAAKGKGEGGATQEAGTNSVKGPARFQPESTLTPAGGNVTAAAGELHRNAEDTEKSFERKTQTKSQTKLGV